MGGTKHNLSPRGKKVVGTCPPVPHRITPMHKLAIWHVLRPKLQICSQQDLALDPWNSIQVWRIKIDFVQSSGGKIGFELCVNLVHNYWNRLKTIFTQNYYPTEFLRQWFARGSNTFFHGYFTIYFFSAEQFHFFDCFVANNLSIYLINKCVKLHFVPFSTNRRFS